MTPQDYVEIACLVGAILAVPLVLIWCLVFTLSHAWHRGNLEQTITILTQERAINELNRELELANRTTSDLLNERNHRNGLD